MCTPSQITVTNLTPIHNSNIRYLEEPPPPQITLLCVSFWNPWIWKRASDGSFFFFIIFDTGISDSIKNAYEYFRIKNIEASGLKK